MTYDHEITLIGYTIEKDEIGQDVEVPTYTDVLCGIKSIGRNEFYSAAQTGLKPSITFVIHGYEYNGEKKVEFEGEKYKVIRTYMKDFEEMELVCEKVIGNG
jgi:SPP1 family predicted phage head-tail adaptor